MIQTMEVKLPRDRGVLEGVTTGSFTFLGCYCSVLPQGAARAVTGFCAGIVVYITSR